MSRKFQMEIQRFHELTTTGNTLVLSCTEAGGGAIPILPASNTTYTDAAVYLVAGGTALDNVVTYTNSNTSFVGPTFEIRNNLFPNTNIVTLGFTTIYDSSANTSTSTRYMTIQKTDEPPLERQSYISNGQKESEVQTTRKKYAPIIIDGTV